MALFWISVLLILFGAGGWLLRTLASKDDWRLFGPFGVLMVAYLYYCAVGPMVRHLIGDMGFQGIGFESSLGWSAGAALISFLGVVCGYALRRRPGEVVYPALNQSKGWFGTSLIMYGVFYCGLVISVGGDPRALYNIIGDGGDFERDGMGLMGFQTYLYLGMSCMIAPCVVMLVLSQGHLFRRGLALLLTANLFLVFITTGFRIRIAFMLLALLCIMMLRLRANPAWFKGFKVVIMSRLAILGVVCVTLLVAMSSARKYGKGVDLEQLREIDGQQMLISTFNDSVIYFVGGAVVEHVANEAGHTYLETYHAGLLRMVPSAIYGEKPKPVTLEIIANAMGGNVAASNAGFAVPFYIEHYISFGWLGLIGGSVLVGCAAAAVENLAIRHKRPLAYLAYALLSAYAFVYFHRGYFPQQLDYLMFIAGVPLFLFYLFRKRLAI